MVHPCLTCLRHIPPCFHVFVGLPLNIYIISLLPPRDKGMEVTDIITLNQAIAEINFVFIGPLYCLCSVGPSLCFFKPLGFMLGFVLSSRGYFQCCMCLEHYMAVIHPLTFLRFKPVRYWIVSCVIGWIVALGFALSCMLTFPRMHYDVYATVYLVILVLNVFCCLSILKKLRHPGLGDRDEREGEMNSVKKKAFQVVSMNLLAFLIQVIPMAITFGFGENLSIYGFSLGVVISLAFSMYGGLVQPVFVLYNTSKLPLVKDVWIAKKRKTYLTCCKF